MTAKSIKSLIRAAKAAGKSRGHKLILTAQRADMATFTCPCGAYVTCLTKPAPNQIAIGGPAVAINCTRLNLDTAAQLFKLETNHLTHKTP